MSKTKKRKNANKALFEPLYTIEDALTALTFFKKVKYSVVHQLFDGVTVSFEDAGHIIGSASVHLNIKEDGKQINISFSGDVGRYKDLLLKAPKAFRQAD